MRINAASIRIAAAIAVVLAGLTVSSAFADSIPASVANVSPGKCWQNGSLNCYHWARTSPGLTLKVENDVSAVWQPYYAQALADWSVPTNSTIAPIQSVSFSMVARNDYASSPNCAGISGITRMCSRRYGNNGWLGLASIWVAADGEHITAGTVKLNDSYFDSATYSTPAWRNLVSCQELAHTLGLNHEDEIFGNTNLGSCMDYTNNPTAVNPTTLQDNEYPSLADRQTLANVYYHADGATTVASGAPTNRGNGNGQGLGPDEDALPPGAGPQNGDVFVKRLPNGMTLITHVFWVRPGNVR